MLKLTKSTNDGEVPRRRHRRFVPFVDRATDEPAVLSEKELAIQTTFTPVRALVRALAGDENFLEGIRVVREKETDVGSVDELARRYARKEGRPRNAMRTVIEIAADSDLEVSLSVWAVAATGTAVTAPLNPRDPTEWTHARHLPDAAAMLTRLGSGRCLICGARLAQDGGRRRYCGPHEAVGLIRGRADREAITAILNAVANALAVPL